MNDLRRPGQRCAQFNGFEQRRAVGVWVDPSGACNLKCGFCPCNNSDYMSEERHKIMSFDVFKTVIEDLKAFPRETKLTLILYGYGEPLLNRQLPDMIAHAKRELGIRIMLTTNGILLDPRLNEQLVQSGLDHIRVSVNALNSRRYEEVCGVTVDFDEYVSNVRDLYKKSRGSLHIEAKIVDAAFDRRSDKALFYSIFGPITDSVSVELAEDFWQDYRSVPIERAEACQYAGASWIYEDESPAPCSYPQGAMMVFSNGDVGLCCSDWKHETKYGSVLENSLYDLQRSEALEDIRRQHKTKPRSAISVCAWCKKRNQGVVRPGLS